MTQEEFDKKVAQVIEARKIIRALREADLINDSYIGIINSAFNGMEKKLNKTKPESK